MSATIAAQNSTTRTHLGSDLAELVKARLTLLVLVTTAVGFYLGSPGAMNWAAAAHAVFGTALCAASAAALNQWWERRLDALMHRTMTRPIPAGRMSPMQALVFGCAFGVSGVIYLVVLANALAASLAAATIIIYIFAYTPLKRRSTTNTLVGAIPGALPPVVGWAAARGDVQLGPWTLFAILYFWQMPHFFAIAWLYRDDYSRAGFWMLSTGDVSGARSGSQAVLFSMFLLMVGGAPAFIRLVHPIYLPIEIALTGGLIAVAMQFLSRHDIAHARRLFLASIIYLPLLLAALVSTKL